MFQRHPSGSRLSRFIPRILGVLGFALLLALGSFLSNMHPVFAGSGGCGDDGSCYTITATSGDTSGDTLFLNDVATNNDPNAVVLATANWNPGGKLSNAFDNHQLGVWYSIAEGRWAIFNEDKANMPIGATFNVMTSAAAVDGLAVQTATTANTSGGDMFINDSALNNQPSTALNVTQNWNPGGKGGTYNNHEIGVLYDTSAGKWAIFNTDGTSIPTGASFNISVKPSSTLEQQAVQFNTSGDSTCINSTQLNGNPNALITVTYNEITRPHLFYGYFTDVAGVWYNSGSQEWCVFDGSFNNMILDSAFFVQIDN